LSPGEGILWVEGLLQPRQDDQLFRNQAHAPARCQSYQTFFIVVNHVLANGIDRSFRGSSSQQNCLHVTLSVVLDVVTVAQLNNLNCHNRHNITMSVAIEPIILSVIMLNVVMNVVEPISVNTA
jgi:hypothetical protein